MQQQQETEIKPISLELSQAEQEISWLLKYASLTSYANGWREYQKKNSRLSRHFLRSDFELLQTYPINSVWQEHFLYIALHLQEIGAPIISKSSVPCDCFGNGCLCNLPLKWELSALSKDSLKINVSVPHGSDDRIFAFYDPKKKSTELIALNLDDSVEFRKLVSNANTARFMRYLEKVSAYRLCASHQEIEALRDDFILHQKMMIREIRPVLFAGEIVIDTKKVVFNLPAFWNPVFQSGVYFWEGPKKTANLAKCLSDLLSSSNMFQQLFEHTREL